MRIANLLLMLLLGIALGISLVTLTRPAARPTVIVCERAADSTAVRCITRADARP